MSPPASKRRSAKDFDHGACITHAHWRVVPVDGTSIDQAMADDGLTSNLLSARLVTYGARSGRVV